MCNTGTIYLNDEWAHNNSIKGKSLRYNIIMIDGDDEWMKKNWMNEVFVICISSLTPAHTASRVKVVDLQHKVDSSVDIRKI